MHVEQSIERTSTNPSCGLIASFLKTRVARGVPPRALQGSGNSDFQLDEHCKCSSHRLCVVFRERPERFGYVLLHFAQPWSGGEAAVAGALAPFGDQKGVARPVPIPNTAVKRPIADGSGCIASARVGRRQIK